MTAPKPSVLGIAALAHSKQASDELRALNRKVESVDDIAKAAKGAKGQLRAWMRDHGQDRESQEAIAAIDAAIDAAIAAQVEKS